MLIKQDAYIRWMIDRDLEKIVEIDGWIDKEYLINTGKQRHVVRLVIEYKDEIVGFIIYGIHKNLLDILRLTIDNKAQRMGFGTDLINRLKSKLSYGKRNKILCNVKDTNLTLQLFLKANGFLATQIIDDQYIMEFFL